MSAMAHSGPLNLQSSPPETPSQFLSGDVATMTLASVGAVLAAETPEDRQAAAEAVAATVLKCGTVCSVCLLCQVVAYPILPSRVSVQISLQTDGIIASLTDAMKDKSKAAGNMRAGALCALRCVFEKVGSDTESFIVPLLANVLEALADKLKPVSVEADKLAKTIVRGISPHGVKVLIWPSALARFAQPVSRHNMRAHKNS